MEALRRRARSGGGDPADARVEGGDLLAGAGRRLAGEGSRDRDRARLPRAGARGPLRGGRRAPAAAARVRRIPAGPTLARARCARALRDLLGQLPQQPDRRRCSARLLRGARGARAPVRLPARVGRGVHRVVFRGRASRLGPAARAACQRRRLQHAVQALLDDGVPVRLRRRRSCADRGVEAVPADGRHRAAGLRPARGDHGVVGGGARRRDARGLPPQARDPASGAAREGDPGGGQRGDDVPLARGAG